MADKTPNTQPELEAGEVAPVERKALSERGASMVEYALLLALIAIVAVGALTSFGTSLGGEYDDINSEIDVAITP